MKSLKKVKENVLRNFSLRGYVEEATRLLELGRPDRARAVLEEAKQQEIQHSEHFQLYMTPEFKEKYPKIQFSIGATADGRGQQSVYIFYALERIQEEVYKNMPQEVVEIADGFAAQITYSPPREVMPRMKAIPFGLFIIRDGKCETVEELFAREFNMSRSYFFERHDGSWVRRISSWDDKVKSKVYKVFSPKKV